MDALGHLLRHGCIIVSNSGAFRLSKICTHTHTHTHTQTRARIRTRIYTNTHTRTVLQAQTGHPVTIEANHKHTARIKTGYLVNLLPQKRQSANTQDGSVPRDTPQFPRVFLPAKLTENRRDTHGDHSHGWCTILIV
eukprot:GHVU01025274.1.p1 GENE.GHVU01025274.1~~GHVU01025274.1.p1  ORF type:complete len:137 (-),score=1.99 GHVU01025274.1:465-875(-)